MNKKLKFFLIILFLVLSLTLNILSSTYIKTKFPNAPIAPDIFLDIIDNNYDWAMILSEMIVIICSVIFIFLLFKNKTKTTNFILVISSFFLIRGILMPVTVLSPIVSSSLLKNFTSFSYGMFPSGHTSIPYLFFLFSYPQNKIWIFYLISTILVAFFLILSKQHYTIDIIGTIFIGYALKVFIERNILKEEVKICYP